MKTTMTAIAAAGVFALAAVSAPSAAQAGCRGCGVGFGILGGLAAGAIIGGAIANSAYPAYAVTPGYVAYPAYSGLIRSGVRAAIGRAARSTISGATWSAIRGRGSSARNTRIEAAGPPSRDGMCRPPALPLHRKWEGRVGGPVSFCTLDGSRHFVRVFSAVICHSDAQVNRPSFPQSSPRF